MPTIRGRHHPGTAVRETAANSIVTAYENHAMLFLTATQVTATATLILAQPEGISPCRTPH